MTKEILEHSLKIYNRIEIIKRVLHDSISDIGKNNNKKQVEVRIVGSENSVILNNYDSDSVISILCKEADKLREEFKNIKA